MDEVQEREMSQSSSFTVKNEPDHGSSAQEESIAKGECTSDVKKAKGTKRKASIDLQQYACEVCEVKLNSASQAYQHFQGKSHQGKVKMLEMAAEVKAPPPNTIQSSPSYLTVAESTPTISPSTLEHFCTLCQKIFNSKNQADQHFSGKSHKQKLSEKGIASINPYCPSGVKQEGIQNKPVSKQPDLVKIGGNIKTGLYSCEHCHITLNSRRQYDQHVSGLRHKIIVGKAKPPAPPQGEEPVWQGIRYKKLTTALNTIGPFASTGASINQGGTQLGQHYCKDCDVSVNSLVQLQQHMTSAKHKAKINGAVVVKKNSGRGRGAARKGKEHGVPSLSASFVRGGQTATHQTTQNTPVTQNVTTMNNASFLTVQPNQFHTFHSNALYPATYSMF